MSAAFSTLRLPAVFGLLLALLACSGCGQATARQQSALDPTVTQIVDEQRAVVVADKQHVEPAIEQPTTPPQPLLFADDHPEPYRPRGPPGLCVLPFFPAPLVLPPLIPPADLKMPGEVGVVVERVVHGQHVVVWAAISPVGWRVGAVRTVGFRYYCKRRGINAAGRGPHCLRHTFCALMTALDVNSFVTMSIVGHLEPSTARWYSQRAMEVRSQVVAWPRGDFHILREAKLDEAKLSPQELAMLQMLRKALKTG